MKRRRAPPAATATSQNRSTSAPCRMPWLSTYRRQELPVAESASRSILIVEDNPTALKLFRLALEAEGYLVRTAVDGRSALEQAARQVPDLVLQDLLLPDMDGIHLLERLRE